jgi:hypothetical protein
MLRRTRLALLALLVVAVAPGVAGAAPIKKLDANLSALWTTVLTTPDAQNPFGSGGEAFTCLNIGNAIAPFGPNGAPSCVVKTGTKIFVAASSVECSTFEGNGNTEAELRGCAEEGDLPVAPRTSLDGAPLAVTEVETGLLHITLPPGNLFGLPAGSTGLSVAHGWVALLHPLTPGTHTIIIELPSTTISTKLIVKPGR